VTAPTVVIVGAGPAGLSAAVTAATAGLAAIVIDERPRAGGRLRYDRPGRTGLETYLADCDRLCVQIRSNTSAWGLFPGWRLALEAPDGPDVLETDNVILATGSTDRALAFEGNSVPGVMTGSGLRRLIREYGVLPGKRTLILGDGPDAAATADAVRTGGGQIVALVPEVDARSISVSGNSGVERVIVNGEELSVDIVAVAVGRQPDLQLATMAELELVWIDHLGGWVPLHHLNGEGGKPGLYVAGDAAGIDSIEICELEGALAGSMLAWRLGVLGEDAVASIRAKIDALRPNRLAPVERAPAYEQPWRVPIEVSQ
jgi:sarcosine oxidase subunit alpha